MQPLFCSLTHKIIDVYGHNNIMKRVSDSTLCSITTHVIAKKKSHQQEVHHYPLPASHTVGCKVQMPLNDFFPVLFAP